VDRRDEVLVELLEQRVETPPRSADCGSSPRRAMSRLKSATTSGNASFALAIALTTLPA